MSKIRSTLDIVMEKTKNLSMTEGEREEIRKKELASRVKGWVQGLLDARHEIEDVKGFMRAESGAHQDVHDAVRRELLARIDPAGDNKRVLSLLGALTGIDTSPIEKDLQAYREHLAGARTSFVSRASQRLASRGISGSAVVPNPDADPEWKAHLAQEGERFLEGLKARYRLENQ
ncbi:MAG TPA: hypothetical protein PLS81_00090 [Deltaproteobacteria bacterium]|nr:hypothetical protein [Deltaproteobacteria bacterium]HOM27841.1 hypothetical protein [Deltaproteobacteria bacterium]HPP81481.1 hypothetical protein [Deltaproteobacteria bacterium]